ncbi:hypothetical protein HU200_062579 [Digitaria exilis]|uniref:Mitochondrial transcription termination factor n=1 Tax=Digitaria exilis TaxID=1010633 RepID=A0A835A385_9POAL|nr:hypothetical protein HU200_062579 [Digitaria exilis]
MVSHLRATLSRIVRSQSHLPTSSHAHPLVSPHRILTILGSSVAAAAFSSSPFAVEDYLVSRCGLTQAQALKAATKLSHLRSRAKPEAVLAYLESTLGVPHADVARIVAIDPTILRCNVEKTLVPRVAELREVGLSRDEIARFVSLVPDALRSRFLRGNLEFWLGELGSLDRLLPVVRRCSGLLKANLDKVTRPNVAFLRQCGRSISEIAATNVYSPRIFIKNPEILKEAVQLVEELGILQDDVLAIVRKQPIILSMSEKKVRGNLIFLMNDVGLEASYIVQRPVLLMYSVERRLMPRHCLLKVLKEKGLLKGELNYYNTAS